MSSANITQLLSTDSRDVLFLSLRPQSDFRSFDLSGGLTPRWIEECFNDDDVITVSRNEQKAKTRLMSGNVAVASVRRHYSEDH